MLAKTKAKKAALLIVAALMSVFGVIASVSVWSQQEEKPSTKQPAGMIPSRIIASRERKIPAIAAGQDVKTSVLNFIKFAGDAGSDRREEIRKSLSALRDNRAAIDVFCEESFRAQKEDHSGALLALSLLGEVRSAYGGECLSRFMKLPFPTTGTVVDGEIIEQTSLAQLQAKAIDGLAYLNTKESNALVFEAIRSHPSIIVRAEAIEAYLWNNRGNTAIARRTLAQYVRKGEEIYLERVRRETGESAESFNRKLDAFLKANPQLVPPKPEVDTQTKQQTEQKDDRPVRIANPPKF